MCARSHIAIAPKLAKRFKSKPRDKRGRKIRAIGDALPSAVLRETWGTLTRGAASSSRPLLEP
jgi:hypothetical protein